MHLQEQVGPAVRPYLTLTREWLENLTQVSSILEYKDSSGLFSRSAYHEGSRVGEPA